MRATDEHEQGDVGDRGLVGEPAAVVALLVEHLMGIGAMSAPEGPPPQALADPTAGPLGGLLAAAHDAGLRARSVWLSPAEAAAAAAPAAPLVVLARSGGAPTGWVVLLARRRGRLRVALPGLGEEQWLDAGGLAALIGAGEEPVPWVVVEPPPLLVPVADGHAPSGSLLRRLVALVRPDRTDLWSVVVFAVAIGALTLTVPIAVQTLVNTVAFGGLVQPVVVLALLLFGGLGFAALLTVLQAYVAETVQRRLFVRVTADLAHRLPRVRLDAFDNRHGPELVNRFFDVVTVQKQGAALLLDGIAVTLQTLVGLIVLSFYHPLMLAFSVVLVLGIAVVVFGLGRGAVHTAVEESRAKYAVAGWLEELARHPAAFRGTAGLEYAAERADAVARDYIVARRRHYRLVLRQLTGALGLQVLASSVVLALGGALVIVGQLTLGQLVASELIVTAIVAAFAKLGKHLEGFYDLLAAVDKLGVLFDLPLERTGGERYEAPDRGASVELRGVAIELGGKDVARDLSFSVGPGERVALVGSVGSGTSSVLDLVYGLRRPADGYVVIDGHDVRDLDLERARDTIGLVRGWDLFEGTVADNVRVGREGITTAQIRRALEVVGLLDDVGALAEGLQTKLGPTGVPLSQGQRSRLLLARAIVARPRLLLLDEPVASSAAELGASCLDGLFDPGAPWTLLVATNREDMIERCGRKISLGSSPVEDDEPRARLWSRRPA